MPNATHAAEQGAEWYRFRARVPSAPALVLLLGPMARSYEVFVNGERIGVFGDPQAGTAGQRLPELAWYRLPDTQSDLLIAIRAWHAVRPAGFYLSDFTYTPRILTEAEALQSTATYEHDRLRRVLGLALMLASITFTALIFLAVPLWRRDAPEYGWCGAFLLSAMGNRALQLTPWVFGLTAIRSLRVLAALVSSLILFCWLRLFQSLFGSRLSTPVRLLVLVTFLTLASRLVWMTETGLANPLVFSVTLIATYVNLASRAVRRTQLLPIHFTAATYMIANVLIFVPQFLIGLGVDAPRLELSLAGTTIEPRAVASLLFAFAMAVLLNQRSATLLVEKERLQQEVDAAAEVQQLLLPTEPARTPGYQTEAVYLPASEVGGDFHYTLRDGDDAFVMIIGDVSGKGLKAAMLVTLIIGILRTTTERRPTLLLRELNCVLLRQTAGGFVTCCCARFEHSSVTIANAGHLPPYREGQEMAVPSGLPLGVVDEASYDEVLLEGGAFTFLSDGVVEASNRAGELFGFERTSAVSQKPARDIAAAAQAWGQNDDITVVTVRRVSA